MKLGALLIFKNEKDVILGYMSNVSQFADIVVGYDDGSTDGSAELFTKLGGELILEKSSKNYGDGGQYEMRQLTLEYARRLGCTHFVVLDADERLYFSDKKILYLNLENLEAGQKLAIDWVNLWNSFDEYCAFGGHWAPRKKSFFLKDHPRMTYLTFDGHKDIFHSDRLPIMPNAKKWQELNQPDFAVLHLQFGNPRKNLTQKAWYQALELIKQPYAAAFINQVYNTDKKYLIETEPIPVGWNDVLKIDSSKSYVLEDDWRYKQVLIEFDKRGIEFFEKLDFWYDEVFSKLWEEKKSIPPRIAKYPTPLEKILWQKEISIRNFFRLKLHLINVLKSFKL